MQLYIPNIGEHITLASDWTFRLFNESRCQPFLDCPAQAEKVDNPTYAISEVKHCTLPAGTVLAVDRVYLRQGLDAFASISFRITKTTAPWVAKQRKRFWAKLDDVNQLQIVPPASIQHEPTITLRPAEIITRASARLALMPRGPRALPISIEHLALAQEARGLSLELAALEAALAVQLHQAATGVDLSLYTAQRASLKQMRVELTTHVGLLEYGGELAA